jgi:hypothetical protein
MSQLFVLPQQVRVNSAGTPYANSEAYFYRTTTLTAQTVYTTPALSVAHSQPVQADSAGQFPAIWLDPNAAYDYRVIVKTQGGTTLDDYTIARGIPSLTSALIGSTLDSLKRTAAEISASVTPTNYAYPPYVDSRRYGVTGDGSTNDATALQSQITAASAGLGYYACRRIGLVPPDSGAVAFRCNSGLTLNPLRAIFDGNGNTLEFSTIATAFAGLTLDTAGQTDISASAVQMTARGVRNLIIAMPSYTINASGTGLLITDSVGDGGGNYMSALHVIDSVSIYGGAYLLKFGNGGFGLRFNNLTLLHGVGHLGDIGIFAPSSWATTDGGESVNFDNIFMANLRLGVWLSGGSMRFHGGNIDGCKTIGKQDSTGTIGFYDGYSEFTDGDDVEYKFDASDANSRIEVIGWEFNVRQDVAIRDATAFGNNAGSVKFINNKFTGNGTQWYSANGGFLFTGSGSIFASGNTYTSVGWHPLVSKKLQWLAYPDIDSANALAAFTLSNVGGGDDPVRATSISDGATTKDAIHFSVNNGSVSNDESAALFAHAVTPGKAVSAVGQIYAPALTSSNVRFEAIISFKDVDGNVVQGPTTEVIATTNIATWTTFGLTDTTPAGAETVEINFRSRATGAVSGDKEVYVSPLGIGFSAGS